jgi:N-acyl-L-homoserine lactone synthetase
MSNIDHTITNEAVIPIIEADTFSQHESARFAVGMLAVGDQVVAGRDEEFRGYLRLRANVYADQINVISKDSVREDGTEIDDDDSRSIHFAVIENTAQNPRVVATMRLIVKSPEDDRPLPLEDFFPEAFPEPAPLGSTEVSRYICRHDDGAVQKSLKWPLFTAALSYIISHDFAPTYGVVEPPVEEDLKRNNVPIARIADPQYLAEYRAANLAFEVDTRALAHNMGLTPEAIADMQAAQHKLVYFGERKQAPKTAEMAV